jgi:hypothetical protein
LKDNNSAEDSKIVGFSEFELEIEELLKNNNLVELHDILPTAFVLTPNIHSEMTHFKKRFSELHIGKGLALSDNTPEKHCKNN